MRPTPAQPLDSLLKAIASLPPSQIAEAECALAMARRRAEALVEIDAAGRARSCPQCHGMERIAWGTTRAGAQRWRCKTCKRTWTGRAGSPISRIQKSGLFIEAVRNMLDPHDEPLSCRKLARRLGVSRDTVWRWRMIVFEKLRTVVPSPMSGIIEADETYQRESRKGSREWVRHERDASQPKPPRKRWYEYPNRRPPKPIARAWSEPILGVVDRSGRASFQHIPNTSQPTIEATLVPQVAPDAMLLFDGAPQYEAIARARGLSFKVLVAGRRSKRMHKAYHLNSVNSLHAQWKDHFRKRWRGPATKYLDGYTRWMVARRDSDPLTIFRSMLA